MRPAAVIVIAAALACGGDAREGLTADSAVVQSADTTGSGSTSTAGADSSAMTLDSTITDSTHLDSTGIAIPTLVLRADSAEGDVLYRRKGKCLSCHGLAGKGLEGLGANLQDDQWLHGDGSIPFIQRTILEGVPRPKVSPTVMPAFATTLTSDEVYRIAAYVYTLSHPGSAVTDTTRATSDTIPPADTTRPPPPPPPSSRAATAGVHPL